MFQYCCQTFLINCIAYAITGNSSINKYNKIQIYTQEQQRVAVGPGNAHCMSIRQVSLRAVRAGIVGWPAAAATAAVRQFTDNN